MRQPISGTAAATSTVTLPCPVSDKVCSYLVGLDFTLGTFVGSVTIKGAPLDSRHTLLALAYKNMATGLNATAALSADAVILVDAAGLDLLLDITRTSGTLNYRAIPLVG